MRERTPGPGPGEANNASPSAYDTKFLVFKNIYLQV